MRQLVVKVLLETEGTVYRDLLVNETNTLSDLHVAIMSAFNFKENQLASFIKDNEGVENDQEYTSEDLNIEGKLLMKDTFLSSVLFEEGDQLTYIYDYINEWKFYLEVTEILFPEYSDKNISLLKSYGESPKESSKQLNTDDAESILMNALLGDELSEDQFGESTDPFDSGDYESLDDFEEFM